MGRAFPGFFLWDDLFVPSIGEATWTAAAAGVEYHSWLVSVDGTPTHNAADVTRALGTRQAGDRVRYEFLRPGLGDRYTVEVPMMEFDTRAFWLSEGTYLAVAGVLLAVGIGALLLCPGSAAAVAVFDLCVALGLMLATAVDLFGPYRFRVLYFFAAGLIPAAAVQLIFALPLRPCRLAFERPLVLVLAAGGLVFGLASNICFFQFPEVLVQLDLILHLTWAASALGGVSAFAISFLRTRKPALRRERGILLCGAGLGFLPALMLLAFYFGVANFPLNYLVFSILAFPAAITLTCRALSPGRSS